MQVPRVRALTRDSRVSSAMLWPLATGWGGRVNQILLLQPIIILRFSKGNEESFMTLFNSTAGAEACGFHLLLGSLRSAARFCSLCSSRPPRWKQQKKDTSYLSHH